MCQSNIMKNYRNSIKYLNKKKNKGLNIYISQRDITDRKYAELDQLDMVYNYFLLKNQIHLNLTYQKRYKYVHDNQMNQVMQHIN